MKIEISICTGLMLNDHSNPYIESTTVLSDTYMYVHVYVLSNFFFLCCTLYCLNMMFCLVDWLCFSIHLCEPSTESSPFSISLIYMCCVEFSCMHECLFGSVSHSFLVS